MAKSSKSAKSTQPAAAAPQGGETEFGGGGGGATAVMEPPPGDHNNEAGFGNDAPAGKRPYNRKAGASAPAGGLRQAFGNGAFDNGAARTAFDPANFDYGDGKPEPVAAKPGKDDSSAAGDDNVKPDADNGGKGGADADAPKITDEMIAAAGKAGLPPAVAKAFGTPDELQKFLDSKAAPAPGAESGEKKPDEKLDSAAKLGLNLDAFKDYPPEVGETFRALAAQIASQNEQISALVGDVSKRTSAVELDHVDQGIEKIGDEKLFGKGRTSGMKEGAETTANRTKLIQAAQAIIAGKEALGQKPISMQEALEKAYKSEFPDRNEARIKSDTATKIRARSGQITGRFESTASATVPLEQMDPRQKAIHNARNFLASRGHTPNRVSGSEDAWG